MPKLRWGPPAFVISLAALVLSLGGTSFAMTHGTHAHGHAVAAGGSAPPASAVPLSWHNLTLRNGWANGGFGSYPLGYSIDSNNVVHLRGSAAGGTDGAMVFRLPNSVRPVDTLWLHIYALDGSSGGLEITPTGQAFVFDNTGSDSNVLGFSSFDGVSFPIP
jgi:hypothetical protein